MPRSQLDEDGHTRTGALTLHWRLGHGAHIRRALRPTNRRLEIEVHTCAHVHGRSRVGNTEARLLKNTEARLSSSAALNTDGFTSP